MTLINLKLQKPPTIYVYPDIYGLDVVIEITNFILRNISQLLLYD